ncbi:MAG: hypothetical protein M1541_06750 [Acidobacteria bacterium]|nr:hypothetical protein [Acidobacteriota bacterium]
MPHSFGSALALGWLLAAGVSGATAAARAQDQALQAPEDKRIFGVLPNNRTTENSIPFQKLTAGQKMTIARKDSLDSPVFLTSGLFGALYQLENQNPSFGQGMAGYGKRYAASYGDQVIGNMMTEGIVPAAFHQDPRYFRLGAGSKKSRAWYALTRIMVARMDSGRNSFNFSEWGGNAAAAAFSAAYYPDTRNWNDNLQKLLIQCATDAFSNVLKEFWPDVKHRLHRRQR